jgi:hypothetical protein
VAKIRAAHAVAFDSRMSRRPAASVTENSLTPA